MIHTKQKINYSFKGKYKIVPVLNYTTHREDGWGSGYITSHILNLGTT
jgi:hypothetical protein